MPTPTKILANIASFWQYLCMQHFPMCGLLRSLENGPNEQCSLSYSNLASFGQPSRLLKIIWRVLIMSLYSVDLGRTLMWILLLCPRFFAPSSMSKRYWICYTCVSIAIWCEALMIRVSTENSHAATEVVNSCRLVLSIIILALWVASELDT